MNEDKNRPFDETSKLPAEKTYGEKAHALIFGNLINFWATFAISGLFVFWVKHSSKPISFLGNKLPREFHADARGWFRNLPFVKALPGGNPVQEKVAYVMADALTINTPGIATILPSAWLGAKFKTPIVEGLDKMHYGDNAEDDPRIAERHRAIETERKPNVVGATLARIGSMTAGVFVGYLIGAPQNFVNMLGKGNPLLRDFKGIDHYATQAGDSIGGMVTKASPELSHWLDRKFRAIGIDWEPGQKEKLGATGVYNRSTRDWAKWTSADLMYTMVTSSTIGPLVGLLSQAPLLSYHQKPHHPASAAPAPEQDRPQTRVTHATADRLEQLQPQLNG